MGVTGRAFAFVPALDGAAFRGFFRPAPLRAVALVVFSFIFAFAFDATRVVLARAEVFFFIRYPLPRVRREVTAESRIGRGWYRGVPWVY